MSTSKSSRTFRGFGIAPGVAIGQAAIIDVRILPGEIPSYRIEPDEVQAEMARLKSAVEDVRVDVDALTEKVAREVGHAEANILRGHSMMLQDPGFAAQVEEVAVKEQVNVEAAVAKVIGRLEQVFEAMDDEYLRDRSMDVRDVGRRILARLLSLDDHATVLLKHPRVVVAERLVPSLTVHLKSDHILGLVSEKGGVTSHAAILARSAGIPAVSGIEGITRSLGPLQTMVVDGCQGIVVVDPTEEELKQYQDIAARFEANRGRVMESSREPVATTDGAAVRVFANVGRPGDVAAASQYHAEGVGLFRTEFEFLAVGALPTEDELMGRYLEAVGSMAGAPVTIRVLDVGGDKFPPSLALPHEENPYLGLRGVRLLLDHSEDLFLPQLRAILRASAKGKVRVMYPMVAGVAELRAAAAKLEEAKAQLAEQGIPFDPDLPQGIMIEVPAAIIVLEDLLRHADFASVGTNDLVQYVLAADRNNDRLADYYDPLHPAVVRTLATIASTASRMGKDLSVCGEIAGDPLYVPLLIGLGYRTLSASPGAIPFVKDCIRHVSLTECEELAKEALEVTTVPEVRELVENHHQRSLGRD